jgi:hypothetical protein
MGTHCCFAISGVNRGRHTNNELAISIAAVEVATDVGSVRNATTTTIVITVYAGFTPFCTLYFGRRSNT